MVAAVVAMRHAALEHRCAVRRQRHALETFRHRDVGELVGAGAGNGRTDPAGCWPARAREGGVVFEAAGCRTSSPGSGISGGSVTPELKLLTRDADGLAIEVAGGDYTR